MHAAGWRRQRRAANPSTSQKRRRNISTSTSSSFQGTSGVWLLTEPYSEINMAHFFRVWTNSAINLLICSMHLKSAAHLQANICWWSPPAQVLCVAHESALLSRLFHRSHCWPLEKLLSHLEGWWRSNVTIGLPAATALPIVSPALLIHPLHLWCGYSCSPPACDEGVMWWGHSTAKPVVGAPDLGIRIPPTSSGNPPPKLPCYFWNSHSVPFQVMFWTFIPQHRPFNDQPFNYQVHS